MPDINPVLLSDAWILAAYLIFSSSYFVFALGKFPWMKIDRPGPPSSARFSWSRSVSWDPKEALQSIDFPAIVLLFSMIFGDYFRIGLPVTIATLVCGTVWLWLSAS